MKENNIEVSVMNIQDLENIKDILEIDFDDFWNYNIFKSEIENPNSTYFVIKINNEIVGFAGVLIVLDEADITNIVVKKQFRGQRYFKYTYASSNYFLHIPKYFKN
jgi:ribosomal-protein-alanine N-acetyltransferase